jgi:cytochrome c oxidase subunit IV
MRSRRHSPFARDVLVWVALLGLTALSYGLSTIHLGGLDVFFSLLIAVAKSVLVLLFFMHLVEERFAVAIVPALGVSYLVLLLALLTTDVVTRLTFPRSPLPYRRAGLEPPPPEPAGGLDGDAGSIPELRPAPAPSR